jgi:predicted transcriptional regulator
MVNRDRHDITIEILKKAKSGIKKTELMREVGLSFLQTKQYLGILREKGLVESGEKQLFKTTKKGMEFLEKCGECLLFKWNKQKR